MSKQLVISHAPATSQQEIDDAEEIRRLFASNTRDHLINQRLNFNKDS